MSYEFLADLIITKINSAASIYNAAGVQQKRLSRPCWALVMKYSGETRYDVHDERYVSNQNHIIILPKGCSYEWTCTASGYCSIIDFECEKECDEIFVFPCKQSEKLLKCFKELEHLRTLRGPFCEMESIRSVYDIILKLMRTEEPAYRPASKQRKIQPAVDYIAQHYAQNITNDELAALTSLSTVYFRKLFTELYGISPISYVHHLRIKKAKEMLLSDYGSITAIAQSLGYLNIYDFSRAFKKYTGLAPTNYLKLQGAPMIENK